MASGHAIGKCYMKRYFFEMVRGIRPDLEKEG